MSENLKSNVVKSMKWTAVVTLFNTIIQPFYRILLALLLLPTEFGYIAVITLIVSFAELLNNIGVGEAIIQRDRITSDELSTLFFFNILVTSIISYIIYINSNFIENFYGMSNLSEIIKLITIIVLINGFTSIFKFYLHRNFHFKETSIIKLIKIFTEVILSTILILLGMGIWGFIIALVTSNIIHSTLLVIESYRKTDFKIKVHFSIHELKEYLSFGVFVSSKKIITFFSQRIDEIIIGGALSSEILGIYYLAKNLLLQLQTLITTSFGQILLPMFSKMKSDLIKQKVIYLRLLQILIFIGTPIFMLIIVSADIFVPLFFGTEWSESAIVFKWLSIPVFCLLLSAGISTSLIYSQNKTVTLLLIDIILVPVYILILNYYNNNLLLNIIFIYSSYILVKFLVIQLYISMIFKIKFKDYLNITLTSFLSGLITSALLLYIISLISNDIGYGLLISLYLLGMILYLLFSWLIRKEDLNNILKVLKEIKN